MTSFFNLLYVVKRPLVQFDYERFGVQHMVSQGHQVTVLDLSRPIYPYYAHPKPVDASVLGFSMQHLTSWDELDAQHDLFLSADLVLLILQAHGLARNNLKVLRLIGKTRTPYLIMVPALYPGWRLNASNVTFIIRLSDWIKRIKHMDWRNSIIARLPSIALGIPPASYVVFNGTEENTTTNNLVGSSTKPIYAHSLDYERFRVEKKNKTTVKNQAVFIDQYMPFHLDAYETRATPLNPDAYFGSMRCLFKQIETKLGLSVVIALHPAADYEGIGWPEPYGTRLMHKGQTISLIRTSKLVLTHTSTAVGFAVLWHKPVMVITLQELYLCHIYNKYLYEGFSHELGTKLYNLDHLTGIELNDALKINTSCYKKYLSRYMRHPKAPDKPLWNIVLDSIAPAKVTKKI